MLELNEVTMTHKAGLSGNIYVDKFFTLRGLVIQPGLTIRLDKSEIERDNPDFEIEINEDKNILEYRRKDQTSTGGSKKDLRFTAYFDPLVVWPAVD